jgi:hypothetical protein
MLVATLVAVLTGCSSTSAPTPSPGNMDDVIANLVLRDATVHRLTSGDPGCPSAGVHDNAVYAEVSLGAQSALHRIYLLRWRRQSDFDADRAAFDECVQEFQALNPGAQISTLEVAPWRAYGPGWSDMMRSTLEDALRATGGG